MKKIFTGILALLAVFFLASCEMKYDTDYPELVQYYCCWGDSEKWNDHSNPSKTLMDYDSGTSTYSISVETTKKNQRFEITKGSGYSIEYCYFNKNTSTYSQDAANQALFPKTADNGYGSLQTVLSKPGTYVIAFNTVTETYTVTAK